MIGGGDIDQLFYFSITDISFGISSFSQNFQISATYSRVSLQTATTQTHTHKIK